MGRIPHFIDDTWSRRKVRRRQQRHASNEKRWQVDYSCIAALFFNVRQQMFLVGAPVGRKLGNSGALWWLRWWASLLLQNFHFCAVESFKDIPFWSRCQGNFTGYHFTIQIHPAWNTSSQIEIAPLLKKKKKSIKHQSAGKIITERFARLGII